MGTARCQTKAVAPANAPLIALPYMGGKSGPSAVSAWINSLVPWERDSVYCEPFCGMLGILLSRSPVAVEIANDLDHRIVTWWKVMRDHTDELARRLMLTPASREEMLRALAVIDGEEPVEDEVELARCVSVVLSEKFDHSLGSNTKSWSVIFNGRSRYSNGCATVALRLHALADRMREVRLESKPAEELLERLAVVPEAVIYCDPPYGSAKWKYAADCEQAALTVVLLQQQGRVAISGYGTEWDHLGWNRHELPVSNVVRSVKRHGTRQQLVEVLWTNYRVGQGKLF